MRGTGGALTMRISSASKKLSPKFLVIPSVLGPEGFFAVGDAEPRQSTFLET
jgi:hypothetical protein